MGRRRTNVCSSEPIEGQDAGHKVRHLQFHFVGKSGQIASPGIVSEENLLGRKLTHVESKTIVHSHENNTFSTIVLTGRKKRSRITAPSFGSAGETTSVYPDENRSCPRSVLAYSSAARAIYSPPLLFFLFFAAKIVFGTMTSKNKQSSVAVAAGGGIKVRICSMFKALVLIAEVASAAVIFAIGVPVRYAVRNLTADTCHTIGSQFCSLFIRRARPLTWA
jgi:hypothetical protein